MDPHGGSIHSPRPFNETGHTMSKRPSTALLPVCIGLVLLLAAGCAPIAAPAPAATTPQSSTTENSSTIQNIVWEWVSVTEQPAGAATPVPRPQDYTVTFYEDGTLSGKADCNTFSGTYSQENGFAITLGPMTLAACGEGSLDRQYLGLLDAVAAGGPDGAGGLALETPGGEKRMLFRNGGASTG
jgi:heat shock protein HslJ